MIGIRHYSYFFHVQAFTLQLSSVPPYFRVLSLHLTDLRRVSLSVFTLNIRISQAFAYHNVLARQLKLYRIVIYVTDGARSLISYV